MDREVAQWVKQGPRNLAEIASRASKVSADDLCTIVYTSGTTGTPKGVELAHRCVVDLSRQAVKAHPLTDQDASICPNCRSTGRLDMVDLVGHTMHHTCDNCGTMWQVRRAVDEPTR